MNNSSHSCVWSSEWEWTVSLAINVIVIPIVAFTGFIGNILICIIFGHTKFWKGLRFYILVLAAWDQVLLISAFWLFSLHKWERVHLVDFGDWLTYTWAFFYVTANFSFTGHMWATIALTIERYLAICVPLWHRAARPNRLGLALEIVAVSVSLIFAVPRYFEVKIATCFDVLTNHDTLLLGRSDLLESHAYNKVYRVIVTALFTSFVPFILLTGLTFGMIWEVRRSSESKARAVTKTTHVPQSRRSFLKRLGSSYFDNKHNRPLIAVLITSILCYTLPTINDLLEYFSANPTVKVALTDYLVDLSNLLVILDASVAFFLYFAFSPRFRHRLIRFLRGQSFRLSDTTQLILITCATPAFAAATAERQRRLRAPSGTPSARKSVENDDHSPGSSPDGRERLVPGGGVYV